MEQLVQGAIDDSSEPGVHVRRQLGKELHRPNVSQHLGCARMLREEDDSYRKPSGNQITAKIDKLFHNLVQHCKYAQIHTYIV